MLPFYRVEYEQKLCGRKLRLREVPDMPKTEKWIFSGIMLILSIDALLSKKEVLRQQIVWLHT